MKKYILFFCFFILCFFGMSQKIKTIEIWRADFFADIENLNDTNSIKTHHTTKYDLLKNKRSGAKFLSLINSVHHTEKTGYYIIDSTTKYPTIDGRYLIEFTFSNNRKLTFLFDYCGNYVMKSKIYTRNEEIIKFIETEIRNVKFTNCKEFNPSK